MTPTSPLSLEHHDPALLALHNRLHQPRHPWSGQVAGETLEVRWGAVAPVINPSHSLWLALDDDVMRLTFSSAPWLPQPTLDPQADALLMELALIELIEPLEASLGVALEVCSAGRPEAIVPLSLCLEFSLGNAASCSVQLQMTSTAAHLLADRLLSLAQPRPEVLTAMTLLLGVECGHAWLSLGDLCGLLPGDVVMLDIPAGAQLSLVLGDRLRAAAEHHGERSMRLLEPLNFVNPTLEYPMTPTDVMQPVDETLNDLPLKLVCQLGTVELSLAQVQQLGVGSLVPLTSQVHEAVDMLINGRRVGRGQLVQIGDGLGVRVQSICKP
ncbi:FliM/FliN family flagellar motor switch protein [Pseudomonas fluorescens]|jgi:type III secretion protein Q|uniref:FliM/FliN family flagellar motor switch protein n=1 Tax=Pseudomonas fluorescens TaxID=294 RepID=UPI003816E0A4